MLYNIIAKNMHLPHNKFVYTLESFPTNNLGLEFPLFIVISSLQSIFLSFLIVESIFYWEPGLRGVGDTRCKNTQHFLGISSGQFDDRRW